MTELHVRKFDINKIKDSSNIVIIGRRCTGKTVLARDILYNKHAISDKYIIHFDESAYYTQKLPFVSTFASYHPLIIGEIIKRQLIKSVNAAVIMDTCCFERVDNCMSHIFTHNIRLKLLNILVTSYGTRYSNEVLKSIDYVFIFHENTMQNRKLLYECYAGMFPTFEVFCAVLDQCTKNFNCLVIDNTITSDKFEDHIFWYKVDITKLKEPVSKPTVSLPKIILEDS